MASDSSEEEEEEEEDDDEDEVEVDDASLARLCRLDELLFGPSRSVFVTRGGVACAAGLELHEPMGESGAKDDEVFLRLGAASSSLFEEYIGITRRCHLKRRLGDALAVVSRTYDGDDADSQLASSFPLPAKAWASWIRSIADEALNGGGGGGGSGAQQHHGTHIAILLHAVRQVQRVARMASRDWPRSMMLWSSAATTASQLHAAGVARGGADLWELEESCRAVLEQCVQGCGEHPVHGGSIWDVRLELELVGLDALASDARSSAPGGERGQGGADDGSAPTEIEKSRVEALDRCRSVIRRRLALPLASNAAFVEESRVREVAGDALLASASHAREAREAQLQIRMAHERAIEAAATLQHPTEESKSVRRDETASPALLKAFVNYINAEHGAGPRHAKKQSASPATVHFLYERALELFPTTSELWWLLLDFVSTALRILGVVREVHFRAMRCCCTSPTERTEASLVAALSAPTAMTAAQAAEAAAVTSRLFCSRIVHLESCSATIEESYAVVQDGLARMHDIVAASPLLLEGGGVASSAKRVGAEQWRIDATAERYLELLLGGLAILRRAVLAAHATKTEAGEANDVRLMALLRALFLFGEQQLRYLFPTFVDGSGSNSFLVKYIRFWAASEVSVNGDEPAARAIFDTLVADSDGKTDFRIWSEYLHFERFVARRPERVRALYQRCHRVQMRDIAVGDFWKVAEASERVVASILDIPDALTALAARLSVTTAATTPSHSGVLVDGLLLSQSVCRAWLQFEREEGSVEDCLSAERKVRARLKEIDSKVHARAARQPPSGQNDREPRMARKRAAAGATPLTGEDAKARGHAAKRVRVLDGGGGGSDNARRAANGASVEAETCDVGARGDRERPRAVYDEMCTIFISRLPPSTRDDELRRHFESCGVIRDVRVVREKKALGSAGSPALSDASAPIPPPPPCKGFAYIQFADESGVVNAETLNGSSFGGVASIFVAKSRPTQTHGRDRATPTSTTRDPSSSHPRSRPSQPPPPPRQQQQHHHEQQQRRKPPRIGLPVSGSANPFVPRSVRRPPPT